MQPLEAAIYLFFFFLAVGTGSEAHRLKNHKLQPDDVVKCCLREQSETHSLGHRFPTRRASGVWQGHRAKFFYMGQKPLTPLTH